MTTWRFIDTGFADGALNMAVDDVLLDSHRLGQSPPVLRVYRWQPAAVSLGKNQSPATEMVTTARAQGVDVVRRPTGGRAVLHAGEFTYGFVGSTRYGFAETIDKAYAQLAAPLADALTRMGIDHGHPGGADVRGDTKADSCFASFTRADLAVSEQKLIGSAQARRGDSFLQHGSLLVRPNVRLWQALFGVEALMGATNLLALAGRNPRWGEWVEALKASFEAAFGIRFAVGGLRDDEVALAAERRAKWLVDDALVP